MTYVLSSVARDDLLSIWAFSADRWDEGQADIYIDALIVRFAWLTRNTGLWHERSELGDGIHSYPEESHVIIFREADGKLQIIRVLHASMDLDQHVP
ncbi:MAG: type II toxin-antitoxin system RelE/ParE family toxin [Gemmatimonadetes bacterium]|nr:type II toxin-antitoxin system RelE/ParE family toxin [Gemmatimonadota bacterium]